MTASADAAIDEWYMYDAESTDKSRPGVLRLRKLKQQIPVPVQMQLDRGRAVLVLDALDRFDAAVSGSSLRTEPWARNVAWPSNAAPV